MRVVAKQIEVFFSNEELEKGKDKAFYNTMINKGYDYKEGYNCRDGGVKGVCQTYIKVEE